MKKIVLINMKFVQLLQLLALVLQWALAYTREELASLAQKSSDHIITIRDSNFKNLLQGPHDATLFVVLTTTSPQFGCALCMSAESDWVALAESWFREHPDGVSKKDPSKALFFAKADVRNPSNIPSIFNYYQVSTVPKVMLFSEGADMDTFSELPLAGESGAERVTFYIEHLKKEMNISDFNYYQPIDWSSTALTCFLVFSFVLLLKKKYQYIRKYIASKYAWAVAMVTFIILMLGGYMYNQIRHPRLAGVGKEGELIYFIQGEIQNQYAMETQVVGTLYGIITVIIIALVVGIPQVETYYKKNVQKANLVTTFGSVLLSILLLFAFSAYVRSFQIKNPAYPFSLLNSFFGATYF